MKKEITYLSLPDYYSKYLSTNYNQKFNIKNSVILQFKIANKNSLGLSLKALYLLEIIFPRKVSVIKIFIKKKKLYFGQKNDNVVFFSFNLILSSVEFIEFFRFFLKNPLKTKKEKLEESIIINRKLKQFDFNNNIYFILDSKIKFLSFYHLN